MSKYNGTVEVFFSSFRGYYAFEVNPTRAYQAENRAERFDCVVNAFDTRFDAIKAAESYAEARGMKVRVA